LKARDALTAIGLIAVAGAAFVQGCGKVGPLRPPAPRGPRPPGTVEARQVGTGVEVAFTVPDPLGPDPSQQVAHTEILRVDYPKGVTPTADPEAFRVRGEVVATVGADVGKSGARLVIPDPTVQALVGPCATAYACAIDGIALRPSSSPRTFPSSRRSSRRALCEPWRAPTVCG
jgi:hypothetical protein